MSANFQLVDKTTKEPEFLNKVDERICEYLGIEVDPIKYCYSWFNNIGFALATGNSIEDIISEFQNCADEENDKEGKEYYLSLVKIAKFIQEFYTVNAWYSLSRPKSEKVENA